MSRKLIISIPGSFQGDNMTKYTMDESTSSDTTLPEEFSMDPFHVQADSQPSWCEETIVKSEVIISSDGMLSAVKCRLCGSTDHVCSPIYNLHGGNELTEKHLETIYRMSDIIITYEKDHASVVCSYCLLKIEEFNVIREAWQLTNKANHDVNVSEIQPAKFNNCREQTTPKDASTQTTDCRILSNASDVRDASTNTVNCDPVPTPEQKTSLTDDGEMAQDTHCETIDVEQYCERLRAKRRKRRSKEQLISEVMRLVKKQFRLEADETNRAAAH